MKFLVLAACLSVSVAQYGLVAHPNGAVVPVDEPAVAAARADHFAAGGGHGGLYSGAGYAGIGYAAAAPIAPADLGYAAGYGYSGPLNLNTHLVGHSNGAVVPVDEPAVAAARADHFAAKGAIAAEHYGTYTAAPIAVAAPVYASVAPTYAAVAAPVFHGYSGPLNLNTHLVAHPNGAVVPVDEPAVAAARADHFAAGGGRGGLYAGHPVAYGAAYGAGYGYSGPLNLNTHLVGHPNGAVVPVDEPAVAAARADHFAAKGAIAAEHYGTYAAAPIAVAAPVYASVAPTYAAVAAPVFHGYSGPLNLNTHLVAHPNGAVVPVDEPAVAAARADHFAAGGGLGGLYAGHHVAYGAAYGAGYGYGHYGLVAHPNGAVVPVDEPAVQAARADHFAAKAAFGY